MFCQQAALDESVLWNKLVASTILCAQVGPSVSCSLCQEAPHHALIMLWHFFQAPQSHCPHQQGHMDAVSLQPQYLASTLPAPKRYVHLKTLEHICVQVSWNIVSSQVHTSSAMSASCHKHGYQTWNCSETPEGSVYKAWVGGSNSAAVVPPHKTTLTSKLPSIPLPLLLLSYKWCNSNCAEAMHRYCISQAGPQGSILQGD